MIPLPAPAEPDTTYPFTRRPRIRATAYRPRQLAADTRARLRDLWESEGSGADGLFIPLPRRAGVASLVLGLLAAAATLAFLFLVAGHFSTRAQRFPLIVEVLGVCLSAVLVGRGLYLLWAQASRRHLGDFLYVDGEALWRVQADRVEVAPTESFTGAWTANGCAALDTLPGALEFPMPPECAAEAVTCVIALVELRQAAQAFARSNPSPAALGAWARLLLADNPDFGQLDAATRRELIQDLLERGGWDAGAGHATLPVPPWQSLGFSGRLPVQLAGMGLGVIVAWALFPMLNDAVRENVLFGRVLAAPAADLAAVDEYLKELPNGENADEVRTLRDHHRFARAKVRAEDTDSPAPWREYLGDRANVLHREEARAELPPYYQKAIDKVRTLGARANRHPQLFQGFSAILESLRRADSPDVTIAFKSSHILAPTTEVEKLLEKLDEADFQKRAPKFNFGQRQSVFYMHGIRPADPAFDVEQTRRREKVIVSRLGEALEKVFVADLLRLQDARQAAAIEVAYHIYPAGTYDYTVTYPALPPMPNAFPGMKGGFADNPFGDPLGARGPSEHHSLLRRYQIDWTITIRPPGNPEVFVTTVSSKASDKLKFADPEPGAPPDPDWAPYAIIVYSAFHDFSNQLITSFGLEPLPVPARYSFKDATGDPRAKTRRH
jgi:hypothetical protein